MSERKKCQELRKLASEMGGESKKAREKFNRWALTLLDEAQRPKFERAIKNQRSIDRKMKKLKLMSRPLAEAPLSTRERKLVEGLLSLLMRTSESIARRPWPQMAHPERKIKSKQIRRAHQEMERDERLLDEMRGRIELGWSEHKKTPYASKLASAKLIDIVRALDKQPASFESSTSPKTHIPRKNVRHFA